MERSNKEVSFDMLVPGNAYKHLSIAGKTGSGKTYLSNWIHDNTDVCSIFFNVEAEDSIAGHEATPDTSLESLKEAVRQGMTVNYVPEGGREEMLKQLNAVWDVTKSFSSYKVLLWIDEAPWLAPEGTETVLDQIVRRGRKYSVHAGVLSQSPADAKLSVLKQCGAQVVGHLGRMDKGYFDSFGFEYETMMDMLLEEHSFVLVDDDGISDPFKAPG